jgi:osmotically inducible protein OsmC
MSHLEKVLHTGKTRTLGGRDGTSRSADGRLDVRLSTPGTPGTGANPEELLAAAWSASFISALKHEALQTSVSLANSTAIEAEIDLVTTGGAACLRARFDISLPGVDREEAQILVNAAHHTCAFSKATRGNIDVTINLL